MKLSSFIHFYGISFVSSRNFIIESRILFEYGTHEIKRTEFKCCCFSTTLSFSGCFRSQPNHSISTEQPKIPHFMQQTNAQEYLESGTTKVSSARYQLPKSKENVLYDNLFMGLSFRMCAFRCPHKCSNDIWCPLIINFIIQCLLICIF